MEQGKEITSQKERLKIANKVSITTLLANVLLSIIKIIAGIVSGSGAMLADGVHTVSDVGTTIAVMVGMKLSARPDDEDHPYGHEKFESEVAKLLSIALVLTALFIGVSGINHIVQGTYGKPGISAIYAAILSIVTKEAMYFYTISSANKINSAALKADAWHHRSDALSSVGTLIGIGGARLGIEILDPIASIVVCVLILKVSLSIYGQSLDQVLDKSAGKDVDYKIAELVKDVDGVLNIDDLKTRRHGNRIYVDVEISVSSNETVKEGHDIAERVHKSVEEGMSDVKHCMVHVNPYE